MTGMLAACLRALSPAIDAGRGAFTASVTVVDNATPVPYRADELPGADRIIRLDRHHSFAAACNAGAWADPSDAVFLLNNDVFLHEQAIVAMMQHLTGITAIVGTRLLFPSGDIQHVGVALGPIGPGHPLYGQPGHLLTRAPLTWAGVTGAAMIVRRDVYDELGGLDERYPFGYEDVDFCLRTRQLGWNIECAHECDSLHFESMTEGRVAMNVPSGSVMNQRWRGRHAFDRHD